MLRYKSFVTISFGAIVFFAAFNFFIWHVYTYKFLDAAYREKVGGLCRIGYINDVAKIHRDFVDLPKRHWEITDFPGAPVDVVTLGDSFANGGAGGKNPYFQDYLASLGNLTVLNLRPQSLAIFRQKPNDFLTMAAILLNSGWLEKYHPKYFIIERVERDCVEDFARDIDFQKTVSSPEAALALKESPTMKNLGDVGFINTGNFKFLLYNLLYLFNDHAFYSETYVKKLDRDLFSGGHGRKFLFYCRDIERICRATGPAVQKMNDNFNILAEKMRQKNIKLFFMPAADKYNVYQPHILKNPYGSSVFFEKLRQLPKKYALIDTEKILAQEIKQGVKDVYYQDDTHWSWKASRAIFAKTKIE